MTDQDDKTAVDHDTTVFFRRPSSSPPKNRIKIIKGEPHLKESQFGDSIVIGRSSTCGLTIESDRFVSREHARIQRIGKNKHQLSNLVNKNITLLNGKAVTKPTSLKTGDRIQVGDTTLEVDLGGSKAGINSNPLKFSIIKPVLYGLALSIMVVVTFLIIPWPSSEIKAYLERGDQFFNIGQYEEAKNQYKLALDIDSEHKKAKQKHQACVEKIEELKRKKDIDRYLGEGQRCFEKRDYICALAKFNKVLELNATHSQARQKKNEAEKQLKEHDDQLIERITNLLEKAEKLKKSIDFSGLKDLAALDDKDKQLKLAEEDVNQAIALWNKLYNLSDKAPQQKAQKIIKSIQESRNKIKQQLDDLKKVHSLFLQARDFYKGNNFLKALQTLEKLVAMNVNCDESIKARQIIIKLRQQLISKVKSSYNKGVKLYKNKRYSQAITHFHHVYTIYPNYQKIEHLYHDAIKKAEPEAQRAFERGNVYEGLGKLEKARKYWNEALKLMPTESHEIHREAKRKLSGQ